MRYALILIILCSVLVKDAAAQEARRFPMRGTLELGGALTFSSTSPVSKGNVGDAVTRVSVMPYVGCFIVDGLELGMNPAGLVVTHSGDNTMTELRMLFAPSFNFRTPSAATPFIEGLVGYTSQTFSGSTSTTTWSGLTWGGRIGIKVGLTEHALLNVGVQYLMVTLNPPGGSGSEGRYGQNELSLAAGWTVWL